MSNLVKIKDKCTHTPQELNEVKPHTLEITSNYSTCVTLQYCWRTVFYSTVEYYMVFYSAVEYSTILLNSLVFYRAVGYLMFLTTVFDSIVVCCGDCVVFEWDGRMDNRRKRGGGGGIILSG